MRRLRFARMMEKREDPVVFGLIEMPMEDLEEDQTTPLRIRNRGKHPVNRNGKSFSNGDSTRLRDSDWNAIETAKL